MPLSKLIYFIPKSSTKINEATLIKIDNLILDKNPEVVYRRGKERILNTLLQKVIHQLTN